MVIDGQEVRRLMDERKTNVSALARTMRTHRPDVSAWINGRKDPSLTSAVRLAKALNCKVDDLLVR